MYRRQPPTSCTAPLIRRLLSRLLQLCYSTRADIVIAKIQMRQSRGSYERCSQLCGAGITHRVLVRIQSLQSRERPARHHGTRQPHHALVANEIPAEVQSQKTLKDAARRKGKRQRAAVSRKILPEPEVRYAATALCRARPPLAGNRCAARLAARAVRVSSRQLRLNIPPIPRSKSQDQGTGTLFPEKIAAKFQMRHLLALRRNDAAERRGDGCRQLVPS